MGLETIRDAGNREHWRKITESIHQKLMEIGFDEIRFEEFKYDGSYAKAKTGVPASKWVFAEDLSRRWVELELKPRTSKGQRRPQSDLYKSIERAGKSTNSSLNITWDREDRLGSGRRADGGDFRIKVYLNSLDDEKWIDTMLDFIKSFQPILNDQ